MVCFGGVAFLDFWTGRVFFAEAGRTRTLGFAAAAFPRPAATTARSPDTPARPFTGRSSKARAGTPTTTPLAGTSCPLGTTLPAPVTADAPTLTGAISTVSEPMKAPFPMWVACFSFPS